MSSERLGGFEIVRELGRDGMGIAFGRKRARKATRLD